MNARQGIDRTLKGALCARGLAVAVLLLLLAGCKNFSLFGELGIKGKIAISPSSATVVPGGTLSFSATGGVGTCVYSMVSGTGTIDASGLYTAPPVTGPESVRVTDETGQTAVATIEVVAAAGSLPNYRVQPGPAFPASGTGGAGFSCTFVIENTGDNGAEDVTWSLYISADGTPGAGDILADQGVQAALPAAGISSSITCGGTWPAAGGSYHLLIQLAAPDDPDPSNNRADSGALSVTGAPAPDYEVDSVMPAAPVSFVPSSAFGPYTFTFTNNGDGPGTAATWEVYLSSNTTIGSGDQFVASGTVVSLGVGASSSPTFSGTWPSAEGTFYLVARVSAVDDPDTTLNMKASAAVTVQSLDVDYEIPVGSVTAPASVVAGSPLNQGFDVHNLGSQTGTAAIQWEVYASPGNTSIGDPGDILVAGSSHLAIPTGDTQAVTVNGSWPASPGSYYLVARIRSTDDTASGNDTRPSAIVTVTSPPPADVSYSATLTPPVGSRAGGQFTASLTIVNNGTDNGVDTTYWSVYASKGDTVIGAGDKLVGSGSIAGGLPGLGGSSGPLVFDSTWPSVAGTDYFLVARILADDNDPPGPVLVPLGPFTVGVTDYSGTVTWTSGATAGSPFTAGLTISNIGGATALAGSATVYWSVYASRTNFDIDAGDTLVGSGSFAGLAAGGTWGGPGNIVNNWPPEDGSYYLVAEITAADDAGTADNRPRTLSPVAVDPPVWNYAVTGVTHGLGTIAGASMSGSVQVNNTTTVNGSAAIHWTVYASLDPAIGPEDSIVASGTWPALTGSDSASIPFVGPWPYSISPVSYRLLARITAAGDNLAGDNQGDSGPIALSPPGVNYGVMTVSVLGGSIVPGQPVNGQFTYQNVGTADGNANQEISYAVYASLNTTLDPADTFVASGTGLSPRTTADLPLAVPFVGTWPLDYGNYYLIVELSCPEDVNSLNDRGSTLATTAVGFFSENLHEPNNDYAGLTNEYDLGVTFKPGMSIRVTGTMSSGDMDDIVSFNTGTATRITYAVTYASGKAQIRICVLDAPNNFLIILLGLAGENSLSRAEPPGVVRYLDLDNYGDTPAYNGAYTCIISAD